MIPHFGWSGPWHPLWRSGLRGYTPDVNVELAPMNHHPMAGRINVKFDVVEPFTIPMTFGRLRSSEVFITN